MSTDPRPFAGTPLGDTIAAVRPRDTAAERAARERLDRMTKPPGSLGVLEDVIAVLGARNRAQHHHRTAARSSSGWCRPTRNRTA